MYSNTAGNRVIEVQNSTGQVIQSGTFNIPTGESVVNVNFNIPQGVDLRITVNGTPNLWRNNGGVNYPYTITDTLSVTGSSAGTGFYYFFYDWEIEAGQSTCSSVRIPAEAVVESCSGLNYESMNQWINVFPNPAKQSVTVSMTATHSDDQARLTIIDVAGRELISEKLNLVTGNSYQKQIDISTYSRCIVYVRLTINNRDYYRKLVIL